MIDNLMFKTLKFIESYKKAYMNIRAGFLQSK